MDRSAGIPSDSPEKRITSVETHVAELNRQIKDNQEAIDKQNTRFETGLINLEKSVHQEISEANSEYCI